MYWPLALTGDCITGGSLITARRACAGEFLEQPSLSVVNNSSLTFKLTPGTLTLLQAGKPKLVLNKAG